MSVTAYSAPHSITVIMIGWSTLCVREWATARLLDQILKARSAAIQLQGSSCLQEGVNSPVAMRFVASVRE